MKRKNFPAAWRPFFLKTLDEAAALIRNQEFKNPNGGFRIERIRVVEGGPIFMNQDDSRLNVRLDEQGRIVGVDGVY